jgi:hypothetical protein
LTMEVACRIERSSPLYLKMIRECTDFKLIVHNVDRFDCAAGHRCSSSCTLHSLWCQAFATLKNR